MVGKTIAIQGCGDIGGAVIGALHEAGASLVIADLSVLRLRRFLGWPNVTEESPEQIFWTIPVQITAPKVAPSLISIKGRSSMQHTDIIKKYALAWF